VGDRLVPGAADAIATLRRSGIPMRFGTNITRMSRTLLVEQINSLGIDLDTEEVITAPIAAASWLEKKGIWNLFLCLPEATYPDFAHFTVDKTSPQAVIIGDLGIGWDFDHLNGAFNHIMEGAEFIALQRNAYWDTGNGLALDAGTFVTALEYATGHDALVMGKPSPEFFQAAADSMDLDLFNIAIVGDNIETDVAGAHACDAASVLVRTGNFQEDHLSRGVAKPDLVIDSIASLPSALGVSFN